MTLDLPVKNQHDWDGPLNAALLDLDSRISSGTADSLNIANGRVQTQSHKDTVIIAGDGSAAGYLKVYSQIGTGVGGHDLVLLVDGLADMYFTQTPGSSGRLFFGMDAGVPAALVNGWTIYQADNSPVINFPSVGGEVKLAGVLRGDNGANKDLNLKLGSATAVLRINRSTGANRISVGDSGVITQSVDSGTYLDTIYQVYATGDTSPRMVLTPQSIRFGPGNAAMDVIFYRVAAGVLRTDSRLDLTAKDLLTQQGVAGVEGRHGAVSGRMFVGLSATNQGIYWCTGTPEGVITAPVGSLALRSDGGAATCLYVKETGVGNTGWVAK